jgi:hypothetical protein
MSFIIIRSRAYDLQGKLETFSRGQQQLAMPEHGGIPVFNIGAQSNHINVKILHEYYITGNIFGLSEREDPP